MSIQKHLLAVFTKLVETIQGLHGVASYSLWYVGLYPKSFFQDGGCRDLIVPSSSIPWLALAKDVS